MENNNNSNLVKCGLAALVVGVLLGFLGGAKYGTKVFDKKSDTIEVENCNVYEEE